MVLSIRRRRDLERCRAARVRLNGVDVTLNCFYVDGRRGVVRLYKLNAKGKKFLEPADWHDRHVKPSLATEERRGHVRVTVARA